MCFIKPVFFHCVSLKGVFLLWCVVKRCVFTKCVIVRCIFSVVCHGHVCILHGMSLKVVF